LSQLGHYYKGRRQIISFPIFIKLNLGLLVNKGYFQKIRVLAVYDL